jgi:hypothetical protein
VGSVKLLHERCAPQTWQRFAQALIDRHVPENQRTWYARRVEACLRGVADRPARMHSERAVAQHFAALAKSARVTDWQLARAIDAL